MVQDKKDGTSESNLPESGVGHRKGGGTGTLLGLYDFITTELDPYRRLER